MFYRNIKPIVKKEEDEAQSSGDIKRELTPELAKISALVTGQPKPKLNTTPPSSTLSKFYVLQFLLMFLCLIIACTVSVLYFTVCVKNE